MNRLRLPCNHPTLSTTRCRRTGRWSPPASKLVLCWQHAVEVARNRNVTELIHWITGERRAVPARAATPAVDMRPMPTGQDAIVRELNRVRTRRALTRIRYALICDLRSCLDRGGLTVTVRDALRAAHARVGIPFGGN